MIFLGLDPGTATTGFGIIEKNVGEKERCITYGCIETPKDKNAGERLVMLENGLCKLLQEYSPDAVAVERLFFFKNLKTVMPVSEARGVLILNIAKTKMRLFEFTPLQVKMAIGGYGRADKKQVQRMVQRILDLPSEPKPDDAADALGLAIVCSIASRSRV